MRRATTLALALLLGAALGAACTSDGDDASSTTASQTADAPAPGPELGTTAPDATAGTAPVRLAATRDGRAYEGAPPVIPHPIGLGTDCIECHLDGSEGLGDPEMPPVTPHPELANCRMCHVYVTTTDTFGETTYRPHLTAIGQRATALSPPLIPHPLTMRERCAVCHNRGEAAAMPWPADIDPPHSEAWNCRMCHVPADGRAPGPRPGARPLPPRGDD